MENAVDALKIAAAVIIFIMAIGTSFSVFGTAKQTADEIINMRDKQAYLKEARLDKGILYTSSDNIENDEIPGVTTSGDRIVKFDDIISTIYRYAKEKYGVTIVRQNGEVIARYDSNTESMMIQYYNIDSSKLTEYKTLLEKNTATLYARPNFSNYVLEEIYRISVQGNADITCGAPWYTNAEEIQKRINADINGKIYKFNGQEYIGKNLTTEFRDKEIVEVINEIDQSKYVEVTGNLLETYEMPTVEIVYIILN